MSDREYWQSYRDRLSSRVELSRAGLRNKFASETDPSASNPRLCHGSIQEMQKVREEEEHLAAVERLLATGGQLE